VAAGQGELDLADEYLGRAHVGLEAEGDRYDAAWSKGLRAQAVAELGDIGRATRLLEEAFALMQTTGSVFGRAGLLEIRGRVRQAAGDETEAREFYQQAAELFSASDPAAAQRIVLRLAESYDPAAEPRDGKWQL